MLGPLKENHDKINFNNPFVDFIKWVVNNEFVKYGPLK